MLRLPNLSPWLQTFALLHDLSNNFPAIVTCSRQMQLFLQYNIACCSVGLTTGYCSELSIVHSAPTMICKAKHGSESYLDARNCCHISGFSIRNTRSTNNLSGLGATTLNISINSLLPCPDTPIVGCNLLFIFEISAFTSVIQ